MKKMTLFDPEVSYNTIDDNGVLAIMKSIREGLKYSVFENFANKIPFNLNEWASFLHLSERTIQRIKLEKRTFDPIQSERIFEIALLYNKGTEVFGDASKFNIWLETENLYLGQVKPKYLLDNSFGINLLKDELSRIEHGILA